ncbi:MAG: transglycosylase SLT domain-containing protein, partial [Draconibacterium sp.]|nr:transglycosylase SLT domain-containing protein [Draconibacterium sp.]
TNKRKELVNFSDYLYLTHQVLVQKKPDDWRKMKWSKLQSSLKHDVIELIGDTVSVRANSSYINRLTNLSEEIGGKIYIDTLPGDLSTDRIIEMVAEGKIKYTVADNNIASINASYYPILDIRVPVSFSQRMAWAVRHESKELESVLNEWIGKMKDEVTYYVIYNKYFKNERDFRRRESSDFYSLNNNLISRYDKSIKVHSELLGWDWRLVAALIYQESKFNPESESWAGAKGLMQMMPGTAERFGVKNRNNPKQSIKGGTEMLKLLWNRFEDIPDSIQRIKFTMAAYNCGYSHVVDARNLAVEDGLDSYRCDNEVEKSILKLSYPENYNKPIIKYGYVRGIEPVTYVRQIFDRFEHYKQFVN